MSVADEDIAGYCCPNFPTCLSSLDEIGPAITKTLVPVEDAVAQITDFDEDGSEDFAVPFYAVWADPVLSLLSCFGYSCCTEPRNRTLMLGGKATYEGQCWSMYVLSCLCCLDVVYKAKIRTDFRRKYGLKGSRATDFWLSCCFLGPCLNCQESIELGKRESYRVPLTKVGTVSSAPTIQEMGRHVQDAVNDATKKPEGDGVKKQEETAA